MTDREMLVYMLTSKFDHMTRGRAEAAVASLSDRVIEFAMMDRASAASLAECIHRNASIGYREQAP